MYLLDTNVLSELERPHADPQVLSWLRSIPQDLLYVSAITLAELIRGVQSHKDPQRRLKLQRWLDVEVRSWLDEGILPVTVDVAEAAGMLSAQRSLSGRPLSFQDSLIAATAVRHSFVMVTRNERDFTSLGLRILNPWTETEPRQI